MLHTGIALELSRLMVDDRQADANAHQRMRSSQAPVGSRVDVGVSPDLSFERAVPTRHRRDGVPTEVSEDPWRAWRVVEPDAAYLRRRAA